jgi:uncharacterized membrane protein YqaE (UPF0057 family)
MKKILFLGVAFFILTASFASTEVTKKPAVKASEVLIPIGKDGQKISLLDLSRIKAKELESLTGQKMKLGDKIGFKIAQRQLKKSINPDGTINNKKLNRALFKADKGDVSKGLYIVLAIFGLAWIAMGVMDNWSGNNWWLNLILTLLFWLPGFIHAMIKMKDYYQ